METRDQAAMYTKLPEHIQDLVYDVLDPFVYEKLHKPLQDRSISLFKSLTGHFGMFYRRSHGSSRALGRFVKNWTNSYRICQGCGYWSCWCTTSNCAQCSAEHGRQPRGR